MKYQELPVVAEVERAELAFVSGGAGTQPPGGPPGVVVATV